MPITIKEEVVTKTIQDKKFWIGYRLKYRENAKERDPYYTHDHLCFTDLAEMISAIISFQHNEDDKDPGYGYDYKIFESVGFDCLLEDGPKQPRPGEIRNTQYGIIKAFDGISD